jgi:glycerol uptake facilitator-like aquaporin
VCQRPRVTPTREVSRPEGPFPIHVSRGRAAWQPRYVSGGITGAHINPAITLGAAIRKQIPRNKVPGYMIAQVLGAFMGAALVFLVYNNAINHFDQMNHIVKGTAASKATYSTFATFPAPYFHNFLGPLIDQIVARPSAPTPDTPSTRPETSGHAPPARAGGGRRG